MEKESYSIDDILSEVKRHREETEIKLKGDEIKTEKEEEKSFTIDTPNDEVNAEPTDDGQMQINERFVSPEAAQKADNQTDEETHFSITDEPIEEEPAVSEPTVDAVSEPAESEVTTESAEPVANSVPEVQVVDTPVESQVYRQESDDTQSEADPIEQSADENAVEPQQEAENTSDVLETLGGESLADSQDNGMVDLLALANGDMTIQSESLPDEKAEKVKFRKTKKGKALISIASILLVVVVAAGIFAVIYANNMLNNITDNEDSSEYEMSTYYDGMDFLQEDFPTIDEVSADELSSYAEYLKQWYQNGDPVSSTHVLNVLLIGEDTRDEEISDTSRADSAIIASINIDTQEIHLTSVLRDMYVYYEIDGEGYYGKINSAASKGGMTTYINTIERYYKIAINNYAVVNFNSFPKIIDALGGVTITITSAEINEINNNPSTYGGVTITQTFDGDEGEMTLTGEQALAYCRIRHIDSDGARANRQKTVLSAILSEVKSSGTLDIVSTVSELSEYVYTGYSKKELISIGNTALKDGWLNFEVITKNVPTTENSAGGQNFSVSPNNWIWIADIPKDAYELQMEIYGKSNINLNENRADYIAMGR